MKRDDFKFKDKSDMNAVFYDKAIDVAFNYFEARTCESCKYLGDIEKCPLENYDFYPEGNGVSCNKWESKDDK